MKKIVSAVVLSSFLLGGCGAWFQNFRKDPVAQTESIITTIATIVNIAKGVFGDIKPNLPTDMQADAQEKFDLAVNSINHSVTILHETALAATEADKPSPSLIVLIGDVNKAVSEMQALIETLKGKQAPRLGASGLAVRSTPLGYAEMKNEIRILGMQEDKLIQGNK